ncbi:MAG: D-amino acid aminotransferase [Gammaproteobacteria bacterium]
MNDKQVFLNGEYLPITEAKISVLDRGFIFGDGVYEVIPAYGNRPFRLAAHFSRLNDSLAAVRIENPYTDEAWTAIFTRLLSQASGDQSIYLHITRGVAPRDHGFPPNTAPTVFVMCNPIAPPSSTVLEHGVSAITLDDIRWQYCRIKSIALLPNILLRQEALEQDATEAILIRNGQVTEGSASNMFIVKAGVIKTPPHSDQLLPGITRDLIVELAQHHHMPCAETAISEQELLDADEVWLSSSTKEVVAITRLNGRAVGNGKPGAVWHTMYQHYQSYKQQLRDVSVTDTAV